ncbi:hypothetical protein I3842_15G141000 [Carya illinoinensis]|uniref:Uncharacterized protein n=1 Tax=Carya illinoinensis TaxID=32201 RepID=A0A922A935_CARIL|nr:hypothetical protein I3842_15G141000 [Carya illinoinensis]
MSNCQNQFLRPVLLVCENICVGVNRYFSCQSTILRGKGK